MPWPNARRDTRCRVSCASAPALAGALAGLGVGLWPVSIAQAQAPVPPPVEETVEAPEPAQEASQEALQAPDDLAQEDLADLGIGEELFLFEDVPVIVSATRRPQQQNLASMPVSILSSSDLHFSGLTSIAEALQFVPGVDFVQIDRNRVGVGVRGFHDFASDRTLTLVDGRNATDPAFGTTLLPRLPLFIEDVERVEVARGPGGAAWGANAFNGVVNVITKRPEDTQGLFLNGQINEFGDVFTQLRYGDTAGQWAYRVSVGYESRESSEDAIDDDDFESNDFARNLRIDTLAARDFAGGRVQAGASFGRFEEGDFEFTLRQPFDTGVTEVARTFLRVDRELDGQDSAHVQWYANYFGADEPSLMKRDAFETDLEGQINLVGRNGHDLSFGANARAVYVDAMAQDPQDFMLGDDPYLDGWFGAFALDRWQARERVIIESQGRVDYYTETGFDWSGRISTLLTVDPERAGVLRFSAAKAFRAPARGFTDGRFQTVPLPPPAPAGTFLTTLVPADDLDNEETWSLEAGYATSLGEGLQWRADAYYQRYDDLIGSATVASSPPVTVVQLQNIDGAEAWGFETSLALTREAFRLTAWYAYNDASQDRSGQDVRAFFPSEHKAGVTARVEISESLALAANYRYSDATSDRAFGRKTPVTHRLDLTLATPVRGRGELMFGVTDVFDQTEFAAASIGTFVPHDTPGLTFFARLQLQF